MIQTPSWVRVAAGAVGLWTVGSGLASEPGLIDLETDLLLQGAAPTEPAETGATDLSAPVQSASEIPPATPPRGVEAPEEAFVEPRSSAPAPMPPAPGAGASPSNQVPTATEQNEVLALDEFEDDVGAAGVGLEDGLTINQGIFDTFLDWLSPMNPTERDNFVLTFGASVGYTDNVLYSATDRISSATAAVNGNVQYEIALPRFQLRTQLTGSATRYESRPGGDTDNNFGLLFDVRYQFKPRITFRFDTLNQYLSQPNPQLIGSVFAFTGNYYTTNTNFFATYEFRPNISFVFSYNLNAIQYEEETVNEGSGFYSQTFSLTTNWLVTPRTTFLVETRYNPIDYYVAGEGSDGVLLLFGVSQMLSPRFEWTLRGGGEYRASRNPPEDGGADDYVGPFLEGEFSYLARPETSIAGTLRFGSEPSGVSVVTQRTSFRVGLELEHAFGNRLSADAALFYQFDNYNQPDPSPDFTQEAYTASLGLRYEFNASIAAISRYDYSLVQADTGSGGYDRSFATIGVEFSF